MQERLRFHDLVGGYRQTWCEEITYKKREGDDKRKKGQTKSLIIRQAYLVRKLHSGNLEALTDLKSVQKEVNDWYDNENEKIKFQAKMDHII